MQQTEKVANKQICVVLSCLFFAKCPDTGLGCQLVNAKLILRRKSPAKEVFGDVEKEVS